MKINIEVDLTPEEARAFLGLPNLQPMQERLLADLETRMQANMQALDPQELMRQWMAPNLKGFEQMIDAFRRMGGSDR